METAVSRSLRLLSCGFSLGAMHQPSKKRINVFSRTFVFNRVYVKIYVGGTLKVPPSARPAQPRPSTRPPVRRPNGHLNNRDSSFGPDLNPQTMTKR